MTPESWKKAKEAFAIAVDLSLTHQQEFLADLDNPEIRQKVSEMLKVDDKTNDNIDHPVIKLDEFLSLESLEDKIGKTIGEYQIIREIGRGGMSIVFEAEHFKENISHRVALKLLKRSHDNEAMLRRFSTERKILASLQHPHIIRWLDAGQTPDGIPFYAMELVEGQNLDEYVEEQKLNLEERLKLFLQICSAVSFAHGKLVIHRDLKPSNIIVTNDGEVKLVDFGIAKVVSSENYVNVEKGTATQFGMMTPRYASPEQLKGETVSIASDIYSLGVVLYELLTGYLPIKASHTNILEVVEDILHREPTKPSETLSNYQKEHHKELTFPINSQELKGDLDTIVLKSLQKESSRRYLTVDKLADDISRYLKGLPISARPDTFSYRANKFVKRNKYAVVAGSLILISLVLGVIVSTWQWQVAKRQGELADEWFKGARDLIVSNGFDYYEIICLFPHSTPLAHKWTEEMLWYLSMLQETKENDTASTLQLTSTFRRISEVQARPFEQTLGDVEGGLKILQNSIDIVETLIKQSPDDLSVQKEFVHTYITYFPLAFKQGRKPDAALFKRVLDYQIQLNQTDNSNPIENADRLGELYLIQAEIFADSKTEKLELIEKAILLLKDIPPDNPDFVRLNLIIGTQLLEIDEAEKALPYLEKNLQFKKVAFENKVFLSLRYLADAYRLLGETYLKLGDAQKSAENLQTSYKLWNQSATDDPDHLESKIKVATVHYGLAKLEKLQGKNLEAVEECRKSLEWLEQIPNPEKNGEISRLKVKIISLLKSLHGQSGQANEIQRLETKLTEICQTEIAKNFCQKD